MRPVDHESLVIVLACGGLRLEAAALDELGDAGVRWARVERDGDVACLAARVRHADAPGAFGARVRVWAAARGWAVTVAPGRVPG